MSIAGRVRFVTVGAGSLFRAEELLRGASSQFARVNKLLTNTFSFARRGAKVLAALSALVFASAAAAMAQGAPETAGGEANLKLPDLSKVNFLGTDGHTLLTYGILFCIFGLLFGLTIYRRLKNLPVHRAMREI